MAKEYWESKLVAANGHLKYLDQLRNLSRNNRKIPTKSEEIVWKQLLSSRKTGFKFLRQKPIYKFIIDFYCRKLLLAIEIDGGYHNKRAYVDRERDIFFRNLNIETLRIDSKDVEENLTEVANRINEYIKLRFVSPFKGNSPTMPAGRQEG